MNERNNGRLKGRVIMLGVTASIAAYKAADLCSRLIKEGADVRVLMTPNATRLIGPVTFEGLTHRPTAVDIFAPNDTWEALLDKVADPADLYIIAPCTADCLARIAAGMANDFVSAAALAAVCPILIAPAMATPMWLNIRTQRNAHTLKSDGIHFVGPDEGRLATGRIGPGRMSQPEVIVEEAVRILLVKSDFAGKKVLVTAGPTQEALDPVRMLTNRSTGRMGIAVAEAAAARGADVTLVLGPTHLPDPAGVDTIRVTTAEQMRNAAFAAFDSADIVIAAAAVSDYRPADVSTQKVKKEEGPANLRLERTPDILKEMGSRRKSEQVLVGFAAETENLAGHAAAKLAAKNLDAVVANDITLPGAGFAVETNAAMWVTAAGAEDLGSMSKRKMADAILDRIQALKA
ncbi:MAG: bifunctional phosphopantothenoylcysteine decarboxylase/phosphopantothenate--cysteine ligase CoaBC [Armatimonadetes bacterium]|nr:bifunctional phosphopantothenoylcysteine decarboxylase/phosphopantothenate--cysteine ligase CoaBC [Armatimonadota bacterium]HOC30657.1 bifunctional phosphopantothenoylcysteine decarboxylase/phosphopantothenate--cysteine ligase CoaBC [Armatimonadota bacterium]